LSVCWIVSFVVVVDDTVEELMATPQESTPANDSGANHAGLFTAVVGSVLAAFVFLMV